MQRELEVIKNQSVSKNLTSVHEIAARIIIFLVSITCLGGLFASPAEAAVYGQGTFTANTTSVNVGFKPRAVIFYWSNQTAAGFVSGTSAIGMGFAANNTVSGVEQAVLAIGATDNYTNTNGKPSSNNSSSNRTNSAILIKTTGDNSTFSGQAAVTGFTATGFNLNWSQAAGSSTVIHYIALDETEFTDAKVGNSSWALGATGNQDVTTVNFQPDFVMTLGSDRADTLTTDSADSAINIGLMSNSSGVQQATLGYGGFDNPDLTSVNYSTGHILNNTDISFQYRNTIDSVGTFTGMLTNGFRINVTNSAGAVQYFHYLALKGGRHNIGLMTKPTTATSQAVTGVGFQPAGLMFLSNNDTQASRINTTPDTSKVAIGAASPTNESSIWFQDRYIVTDTGSSDVYMGMQTDKAILMREQTTTHGLADLTSMDAGGFTLNWTTSDSSARRVVYWAVGSANSPATLAVNEPNGTGDTIAEGGNFTVNYNLSDSDNVTTVSFFYDTDTNGAGGTAISGCATQPEATGGTCVWNTSGVAPGSYYVYGTTSGDGAGAATVVSSGTMTINDAPALSISEPNGTGDTVMVGGVYNITYTLTDSDSTVTAAFYYDSDAAGFNGTAISGCGAAAEGGGVTCAWNTTGMTPGNYYVYGISTTDPYNSAAQAYSPGVITINPANSAATLVVNQPDGTADTIAEGGNFTVNYNLSDSDNVTTVSFFYDTDTNGAGGTAISGCATQPEATGGTCVWNTSGVAPGSYYVYGTTSGDGAGAATVVSSGTMTINDAPALSISEPNGTSDTVAAGGVYNITYTLTDSDNTITAAFYYDSDAAGFNGTAISGCGAAAEGSGVTCAWNTTGMSPGNYYVYGISTTDAYNSAAQAYSPGVITISATSVLLTYASGDDGTNPGGGDSIAGISRSGGGDDSNNLQNSMQKINVEYEFRINFIDASGGLGPQVEPKLYLAHRDSPVEGTNGDFFVYPLVCTGATWSGGKTCSTTMKLGPAASHKFYFYAKGNNGTVAREPSSGYIDGPEIYLINGYSLVGASRNINSSSLDGVAAFNSPYSYGWVSAGLDTAFDTTFNGSYVSVTSAQSGKGYFVYTWSPTLPQLASETDVTAATHTIALQAGWNIISNPYNGNVTLGNVQIRQNGTTTNTWSNAASANWIEPAVYYYQGSDWGNTHASETAPGAVLVPWLGYWMYVKNNINSYELIITKPAQ